MLNTNYAHGLDRCQPQRVPCQMESKPWSSSTANAKLAQCVMGWYNPAHSIRDFRSDIPQKDHKEVTP